MRLSSNPRHTEKVLSSKKIMILYIVCLLQVLTLALNLTNPLPNGHHRARSRELHAPRIDVKCGLHCYFPDALVVSDPFHNGTHYGFHDEYIQYEL